MKQWFKRRLRKSTASVTPENAGTDKALTPDSTATVVTAVQVQQCQSPPDAPPYAYTSDLWQEAYRSLDNADQQNLEQFHKLQQNDTARGIAEEIEERIRQVFDKKERNQGAKQIIERALAVLNKFLSVGDVVASFDPAHAALPWAAVRSISMLLAAHSELHGMVLAGISQAATLLAQCDIHQQLYMVGAHALRPPETSLGKLRLAMIKAYIRSQKFLSFAIESLQKRVKIAAVFKLDVVREHVRRLSESEQQVQQVANHCEAQCNRTGRAGVKKLLEMAAEFMQTTQHSTELILEMINDKEQLEVLNWISEVPYGSHHLIVKEIRTAETCEWLMHHKPFIEWDTADRSSIFWLHGSPGTGKTFLTSKVIDRVQNRLENEATQGGFAYFYCNRNEECRREPLSVLRALVRQLSTVPSQPKYVRKQLLDTCRELRSKSSHLGFDSCRSQLLQSVNGYSQTTIILDALDECSPDRRWKLMDIIQSLISESERPIKVFIASRPDHDIRIRYSRLSNVKIYEANNQGDIEKYVNEEINRPRVWGPISPSLRDYLVDTLLKGSHGMFQWAHLQIKQVLELPTEEDIRARLGRLPSGLKEAYDEIYGKIAKYPRGKAIVDSAITWMMSSDFVITSDVLLDAIRIRLDTDQLGTSNAVSEAQLLSLCNHLLVVDSTSNQWLFSHLSVLEYFESNHWTLVQAHCSIVKVCFRLLLATFGGEMNEDTITRFNNRHKSESQNEVGKLLHVQKYVIETWVHHVTSYERLVKREDQAPDPTLLQLARRFLGTSENTSAEYRKWRQHFLEEYGYRVLPSDMATLLCQYSISPLPRDWWDEGENFAQTLAGFVYEEKSNHMPMSEKLARKSFV